MDSNRSTVLERPTLTFCVEGLQAREELLFKAFVRLLDHQTHQQWSYQPLAVNQRVDLLVVADGVEPTYPQAVNQQPPPVLRLGGSGGNGHGYLSWPLRPDALEAELNRLGGQLIRQRNPELSPVSFEATAAAQPQTVSAPGQLMRLLQWPSSRLLAGTGRMRLATLLTGKAMSMAELVSRSALPLPICQAFVDDLLRAQLLSTSQMPQPASAPASLSAARLEQAVMQRTAPSPKVVQLGLLDRIRMRLGIKSPSSV